MKQIAAVTEVSACLSVPTLDEKAWRATEPHTPNPRARLEAVAELNRNGIPTGVLIAPLIPGINDAPEQVEKIVELATEAEGHLHRRPDLFLSGPVREIFMAGCATTARTSSRATSASTRRARSSHRPSATRSRAPPASRGCARTATWTRRRHRGAVRRR